MASLPNGVPVKVVSLFQEEDEIKPLRWRPVPPASGGSGLGSWRWCAGACCRGTSTSPSSPAWLASTVAAGGGTSARGPSLGNAAAAWWVSSKAAQTWISVLGQGTLCWQGVGAVESQPSMIWSPLGCVGLLNFAVIAWWIATSVAGSICLYHYTADKCGFHTNLSWPWNQIKEVTWKLGGQ